MILADQTFKDCCNDPSKDKYKDLKANLESGLTSAFCNGNTLCSFSITGFSEGSVIANFLVTVASGSSSYCQSVANLIAQMNSIPQTIPNVGAISAGSITTGRAYFVKKMLLFFFQSYFLSFFTAQCLYSTTTLIPPTANTVCITNQMKKCIE